jgi:sulfotransferase family protein
VKPPVVIGAMGGSGTRVVARIVSRAGVFIGRFLNVSEDSLELAQFCDRWINRYLLRAKAPFCVEESALMDGDLAACVARHRAHIPTPDAAWGWKEPRSLYLLPFFHEHWPDMKFIHVVRDGRDMAFSPNQHQLRRHGAAVLGVKLADAPQPVRSAALWAKINLAAANYAQKHMAGGYLRVNFETLCERPRETASEIVSFLGSPAVDLAALTAEIAPPASIGRWRSDANGLLPAIHAKARVALRRFGYH